MGTGMPRILETTRREKGFSLVEIMVGMVIGMLGMLIVLQSSILFEDQKRRTTSGAEAMENGLVAMTIMERDLRMAGYGLTSPYLLGSNGCTSLQWWLNGVAQPSTPTAPVRITDGGGGLPDSIVVSYGNAMSGVSPAKLTSKPNGGNLDVNRATGFNVDDLIIVAQNSVCTMVQITNVNTNALKLQNNPGKSPYNLPPGQMPASWNNYSNGAYVFTVGQITNRSYSVGGSALQTKDATAANPLELVSNIVNIQAQYGIAPTGSNIVNCWTNASGSNCGGSDWASPTAAEIARIKAVRIAVVARSTLPEKPNTSGTCDATTAANAPESWSGGPAVSLTADPDWQCYRYRTYQTIVPLRNVIWANL